MIIEKKRKARLTKMIIIIVYIRVIRARKYLENTRIKRDKERSVILDEQRIIS